MEVRVNEIQEFINKCENNNRLTTQEFTLVKAFLKHTHQYTFIEFLNLHNLNSSYIIFAIKDTLTAYKKDIESKTTKQKSWWSG